MPEPLKTSPEETPNLNRREHHQRNWNQDKQCQQPVLGKQNNQNPDDRQAIDDQNLQAINEEVIQLIDILRDTRDQRSRLTLVVVRQTKLL